MPIRQLPEDLINRIAAGEVVERPASVIKELVENSIDAGARRIVVTTAGGGKALMRIEDDGHGMDRGDLVLSVERHATSKLSEDELDDIRTLGFRGEALASIGSVAELSICSRTAQAESGLRIDVRNGVRSGPVPQAMNRGTIVEVKNLFAKVPARLKFLKSDRAEAAAITDVLKRLAMANPSVHFVLQGSDRSASNWPAVTGAGALEARLAQVIGDDFAQNAVALATERHGVAVAGLAGLPTYTRANSLSQFYFVNGRSVRDKVLVGAIRAAYADFTFRDRFPVVALYLAIDPAEVDVNVHPAKAELRFRDAGAVRSAVIRAIAVRETPALLGNTDIDGLVRDLADGLAEWDSTAALSDRMESIIARMACHGSVRSGRRLRVDEMNALLRDMEATPHSGQCIHGRPTYVELKKKDIERLFGRSR